MPAVSDPESGCAMRLDTDPLPDTHPRSPWKHVSELRLLRGLLAYPAVRETLRASGFPARLLFADVAPCELVCAAMENRAPYLGGDDRPAGDTWLAWMACYSIDEEWALHILALQISDRAGVELADTFEWAALALRERWFPPDHIGADVMKVLVRACEGALP
ncbi:MAG: hypothetical protein KAS72_13980 [Phycisphaerales bacterium]|nr:hypothetical protein [Phycisphaerales bacterium]